MRLELLQGVAAFHCGDKQASQYLSSALDKWQRLQVNDEAVATLASMGFTMSQVPIPRLLSIRRLFADCLQSDMVAGSRYGGWQSITLDGLLSPL